MVPSDVMLAAGAIKKELRDQKKPHEALIFGDTKMNEAKI